jgi:HD superfamily phosphohydrolase
MYKNKIIYDIIHGYIEIDKNIECIINCESFQRLKFINQLTAQHLYPSANHTRFEHSLGVMKLSKLFFDRIKRQIQKKLNNKTPNPLNGNIDFLESHLLYASLLHDVGHAPLSHVGEHHYKKDSILSEIRKELRNHNLPENIAYLEKKDTVHEIMSCYIVIKKFKELFDNIYSAIDYEFLFFFFFCARYERKFPERNIIISILNTETFDTDKLDYLLRDNYMTGRVGPEIDISRLLIGLTVNDDNEIAFTSSALSALQKIIDCRDNIYIWVCNHHTVVYTDYLYENCFEHLNNLHLKEETDGLYVEAISSDELFSCEAISEKCVDDNDALHYIRKAMWFVKDKKSRSNYTKNIVVQLMNRNFLKPTWKTLFEFQQYLELIKTHFNGKKRQKIIEYVTGNIDNRRKIVHYLCDKLSIELGNLFIVSKKNKFYCEKLDQIYIIFNGKEEKITDMLPPRDYSKLYDNVAFYIFCEDKKKEKVKEYFIKYFKDNKDEI